MGYVRAFEANPTIWCIEISFSIFHDQWVNQSNYGTTFDSLLLSLSLKWKGIATLSFVTLLSIKGFIQKKICTSQQIIYWKNMVEYQSTYGFNNNWSNLIIGSLVYW